MDSSYERFLEELQALGLDPSEAQELYYAAKRQREAKKDRKLSKAQRRKLCREDSNERYHRRLMMPGYRQPEWESRD